MYQWRCQWEPYILGYRFFESYERARASPNAKSYFKDLDRLFILLLFLIPVKLPRIRCLEGDWPDFRCHAGKLYYEFDGTTLKAGYPKRLKDIGVYEGDLDAGFWWKRSGRSYLFKGEWISHLVPTTLFPRGCHVMVNTSWRGGNLTS